ncbi:putative membrane protein [Ulvibacter sp. MAR_2010_11]|nr:putative membrane protein [Ulvibacter sp. MAR_2010_11]
MQAKPSKMQDTTAEILQDTTPLFTNDTIVFGVLMVAIGIIFYTSSKETGFWDKFYKIVPALFMAYFIPALFTTFGIISPEWISVSDSGEVVEHSSNLYYMSSRYLLPAALVLMTLSIDLKAVYNLGPKALIMFLTGTAGIILGGPIAVLIIGTISPETVGGAGADAVWRGLSTLAGSWIGGGANQTAMLEIYGYNQALYGGMVFVDIVVANIWMAIILIGIGKAAKIDKWLKADTSAIESLKEKVSSYAKEVDRNPTLTDLMILAAIAFGTVGFAHLGANYLSEFFTEIVSGIPKGITRNIFTFLDSSFFWMITITTIIGVILSFTKAKSYEGAGASKFGSVFIYILVASIGMKMDLTMIFDNFGLIFIGIVWMIIHAALLIIVAKLIRAPYFFLAVGSQANVGGAASAPIVASAFHPSLATVGVLLAVFGYAIGTVGAILCTVLMQLAATS